MLPFPVCVVVFVAAQNSLLEGNPMDALGGAMQGAQQAAEIGAKLTSNVGGFFKSFF
jgi:hypothetical protein